MRVLVIAHGFPPLAQGGAELYAWQHAQALHLHCGDDVVVLTREQDPLRAEYEVRREERDGMRIAWVNNTFRATRDFEDSYRNPAIAAIATRLLDQWRPDVAHLHHLTCLSTDIVGELARRGVPIVYTLHDYWLLCHRGQRLDTSYAVCDGPGPSGCDRCVAGLADAPVPGPIAPVLRAIEARLPRVVGAAGREVLATVAATVRSRVASAGAARTRHMRGVIDAIDYFLAPSESIRSWFMGQGVSPDRVAFSPNGFDQESLRGVVRLPAPHLRIGYIGTLMVSKAPDVLLEAYRRLPAGRATVELIGASADYHGETGYRDRLAPLLSLPGVRVGGPRPRADIPAALGAIDVLVTPSIWPENSPLVIQEALLSGAPVVASRIGGIPELVRDGWNGLLFEPGDVEGLARALTRLLDEPGLLDRLRAGARLSTFRTLEDDARTAHALYERLSSVARTRAPQRRIAAVVVNHGTPADTYLAVRSLVASERPLDRIVVVDNNVTAELAGWVEGWGDAVSYVHTGHNLGFAGGVNVGVRAALAEGAGAVLLVNSDAVVAPTCLGRLEDVLSSAAGTGIVAPLILARTDPAVVASAGIDYDMRTGRMRERHAGRPHATIDSSPGERVAASGCVLLVTREAWERAGLLDERYFFGFEDIDLCLRARKAGLATKFEGRALAYHHGGGSLPSVSPRRFYFAARNHLLLARDHRAGGVVARIGRPLIVMALNLAHALTAPGGSRLAKVGATLRGGWDFVAGRTGPPPP